MEALSKLLVGFGVALQTASRFYGFVGLFGGTLAGVLAGAGPAAAAAILNPFASSLSATSAISMLAAIFVGAMYGGSTTSILLSIPSEAVSVVARLDGYQMARLGRGGSFLGMAPISSLLSLPPRKHSHTEHCGKRFVVRGDFGGMWRGDRLH